MLFLDDSIVAWNSSNNQAKDRHCRLPCPDDKWNSFIFEFPPNRMHFYFPYCPCIQHCIFSPLLICLSFCGFQILLVFELMAGNLRLYLNKIMPAWVLNALNYLTLLFMQSLSHWCRHTALHFCRSIYSDIGPQIKPRVSSLATIKIRAWRFLSIHELPLAVSCAEWLQTYLAGEERQR